jgi:hypothetical protein
MDDENLLVEVFLVALDLIQGCGISLIIIWLGTRLLEPMARKTRVARRSKAQKRVREREIRYK